MNITPRKRGIRCYTLEIGIAVVILITDAFYQTREESACFLFNQMPLFSHVKCYPGFNVRCESNLVLQVQLSK